ncbi:MAG TPA: hypothetical protein VMR14_10905 [Streptosporangiaceae bacterium]|nr:hypothetical protein [Streptosporangiaceae bacterium]
MHLARKPSRLIVGTAAATVLATAGIAAGFASTSAPVNAASDLGAASHPAARIHVGAEHSGTLTRKETSPFVGTGAAAAPHQPAGHAADVKTAVKTAVVRGSHHQFTHVKLAVADHNRHGAGGYHHAAWRPNDPARHFAVVRHHFTFRHHVAFRHYFATTHPAAPYLIYDSTTPSALPAQHVAAAYATGDYAASPTQLAGHRQIVWIDTTGHDPAASALDVEPGDATPSLAANWADQRLSEHPHALAVIYTMRSEWPAVQAAVDGLPQHMQDRVRWWIADPTGYPHVVPGAAATQWYWGSSYDITTATPRF